ncbi:hypothetical protein JCM9279_002251 [Rhodotorula babjevae]
MALSARTHVWPFNVAAPKLAAIVPHGLAELAQQHQQPIQPAQQPQQQAHRPRRPLKRLRLLSLPLELVLSILSFLEPPDLLALSCTSRTFANLLRRSGDRRALKLWTQARLNMEVPELTSDLRAGGDDVAAEVLLARLIGGETCQRLTLVRALADEDDVLPTYYEYFVPDALAISAHLTSISAKALGAGADPDAALTSYVSQRDALRERMHDDAEVLQFWLDGRAVRAAGKRRQRVASRLKQCADLPVAECSTMRWLTHVSTTRMSDKLKAHGFDQEIDEDLVHDFGDHGYEPPIWYEGAAERQERERRNDELKEFCTSDEPLDDDDWDEHKARFIEWVAQTRRDRREGKKNYAYHWQRHALKDLYSNVKAGVDEETVPFLPPLPSFLRLPSLRSEWTYIGPLRTELYADKFRRLLPCAIADTVEAMRTDRLVLLDRLARTLLAEGDPLPSSILSALSSSPSPFIDRDPRTGVEPAYLAVPPADVDAVLERAVALFRCGVCSLLAPFAQLVPHVHASHGVRAPPRSLVAPAQVRALVRSAAGATATAEDCEKMGRVWEISGGGVVAGGAGAAGDGGAALRPWKLKGQTWGEVMQYGFHGVSDLKVGRTLRRSTLEGPGAPPAPPARSSADGEKVRLLGFDAGEYTESAWAWP